MLRKIDGWVLSKIEKCCHKFQEYTGYTNYWLSSKVSLITLVFVACSIIRFIFNHVNDHLLSVEITPNVYSGLLDAVFILFLAKWAIFWEGDEARAYDRLQKGLANPQKNNLVDILIRILFGLHLPFSMLAVVIKPTLVVILIVTTLLYLLFLLLACDPLPPCQGKIREKLATLFMKPAFTKVMD